MSSNDKEEIANLKSETVTTTDPVCGMSVEPESAGHRQTIKGIQYYFCSSSCSTKFAQNPEKYLERTKNDFQLPTK